MTDMQHLGEEWGKVGLLGSGWGGRNSGGGGRGLGAPSDAGGHDDVTPSSAVESLMATGGRQEHSVYACVSVSGVFVAKGEA